MGRDYRGSLSTDHRDGKNLNMWVDYRGSLSLVYNDVKISPSDRNCLRQLSSNSVISSCGQIVEGH